MKIINAIVNNVDITLEAIDTLIENQVNNAKVIIKFDDSWEPFDKYVVFKDEDLETYKVAVIDNEVILPSELKSGFVEFQIYGQVLNNDIIEKRQPTKISGLIVEKSLSPDGLDVSVPSPTEWDNYVKQIEDIANRIVSDEANRIVNEKNRQINENTRLKNETDRITSEEKRISAETDRNKNETTRNDNEKKRTNNEDIRIKNEKSRQEQEEARIANEKERTSNEKIRVVNEDIRSKNEESRQEYITQLKQDVADGKFNGECNFATFNINLETGNLEMNKTEDLLLDFAIEDGKLEVLI